MAETYNNYQPEYSFDNRQYEDGQIDSQTQVGDFENGVDLRGMDYARDTRGREPDYSRDGGRGSDYGYDGGRGGGDRGGGYARDGIRGDDSNRFSEGYEENRGSSRDRERERDRSRRDRDGRRERRHPRDRDHERSRERRERRERDRSPSSRYDDSYSLDGSEGDSQSYRDRERDAREMREDRGGEKWMTDTPTNTVLLRGLPPQVDEKDIRAELMMFGAPVKDVRLMRRSTGASRGFAFVEFQNVTDAQRWMDQKQGALNMLNQYQVSMHYSTPRVGPEKFVQHKTDWTCSKCGVHNFKRRDYCFKCNISRDESDKTKDGDGFDQVGTNPCNTLIFRGLDALTTEESLDVALRLQTTLQSKNVRIIRDPVTNTSRGYGFCEMNSIQESTQVIDFLTRNNVPLEVDGKQVLTSYAKNTFSTVMATLNSTSQNPAWDYSSQQAAGAGQPGSEYYNQLYQAGVTTTTSPTTTALTSGTPGEYDQTYYDQATGQYYDSQSYEYSHYYSQYGQSGSHPLQTDSTNAAAAVAQAAIAQANAAKNYNKQTPGAKKAEPVVEQAAAQPAGNKEVLAYPAPDVSTYQFDKSSGYYYDPSTGLYYDANSQVPCPVSSCSVERVWVELRDHWFSVHKPTITTYSCPHPKCQFQRSKKAYPSKHAFTAHICKVHGIKGEQHDLLLKLSKSETKENKAYVDPGNTVCPQPVKVQAPETQVKGDAGVKGKPPAMVESTAVFTGQTKRKKHSNPNLIQVNTVYIPPQPVKHVMRNKPKVSTTKSANRPATQPTGPATQQQTGPATQQQTRPATQQQTRPATQQPTRPAAQQPTRPAAQQPTRPATQQPTRPATQQPTRPATQQPTQQPTRPEAQPETQPETEQAPQRTPQPETQEATPPAIQQGTQPSSNAVWHSFRKRGICPVQKCVYAITSQDAFRIHWVEKHQEMHQVYKCSQCSSTYNNLHVIKQHMTEQHKYKIKQLETMDLTMHQAPNNIFMNPGSYTLEMLGLESWRETVPVEKNSSVIDKHPSNRDEDASKASVSENVVTDARQYKTAQSSTVAGTSEMMGRSLPATEAVSNESSIHLRKQSILEMEKCPIPNCNYVVTTQKAYRDHWNNIHTFKILMYNCPDCMEIVLDQNVLKLHMKKEHNYTQYIVDGMCLETQSIPNKQFIDPGPFTQEILGLDKFKKTDITDVISAHVKEAESDLTKSEACSSSRSSVLSVTKGACIVTSSLEKEGNSALIIDPKITGNREMYVLDGQQSHRQPTESRKISVLVGRQPCRKPSVDSQGKKKLKTGVLTKIVTPPSTQPSIGPRANQKTAVITKDVTTSSSQRSIGPKEKGTKKRTVLSGQTSSQSRRSSKVKEAGKALAATEDDHSSDEPKGSRKSRAPKRPRIIEVAHPSIRLPRIGRTEKELTCFLSWTDEYLILLEQANEKASRQLMELEQKE